MLGKKGVSEVIASVLLIALVMVLSAIIWMVVQNLINPNLEQTSSCFGIFDKVKVGNTYTCYDSSSDELRLSLEVGEVDINAILISITGESATKTLRINDTASAIDGVTNYSSGTSVQIPGRNSGLTYLIDINTIGVGTPSIVKIAPFVGKELCSVSDSITSIPSCSSLT